MGLSTSERKTVRRLQQKTLKEVRHLMDCQRDCIESGNISTPSEQEAAIRAIEQLWERISGHFGLTDCNSQKGE